MISPIQVGPQKWNIPTIPGQDFKITDTFLFLINPAFEI